MVSKATYLLFLILVIIAGCHPLLARQTLGVIWEPPQEERETLRQLNIFSEAGIEVVELMHPADRNVLNLLSQHNFTILVRTTDKYYTLTEIKRHQQNLSEKFQQYTEAYSTVFNVRAIGLFTDSQLYESEYIVAFSPILDTLEVNSNKEFYFVQQNEWFYFHNPFEDFAYSVTGSEFTKSDLTKIDNELSDLQNPDSEKILFFYSSWFLEGIQEYPELFDSLRELKTSGEWLLPMPQLSSGAQPMNWYVLILLFLWTGLAFQLRYVPVSAPMIARYFLAHRFYADDILHYRERSAVAGISLMVFHAFFGGLVAYITARTFMSEAGLAAFFDHLPGLAITGDNYISFFFLGVMILLITQPIALLWIYLPNKIMEHFSQVINLYAGIFCVDFLLVTVMLTLFLAGGSANAILILAVLFIFFWFAAFYIAAGDASKFMGPGKVIYLLLTIGLHTAATALLIVLLLSSTELLEVIELAVNL